MKTPNRRLYRIAILFAFFAALSATVMAQNEAPPDGPFKSSHLMNLPADISEAAVLSMLGDINQAIAQAGCGTCRYTLFKVYGQKSGNYSYMWEAQWPSGAVYTKVHSHPAYQAAENRHPEFEKIMKDEIYNRYVEVPPAR